MKQSLTQAMSWLHTWAGLVLGWALVAIFLTGTLAVFDKEINQWMQPELPAVSVSRDQAVNTTLTYLREHGANESMWQVALPTERSNRLAVAVGEARGGGGRGNGMTVLDPATGEIVKPRETAGGNFFFRFHYTLHFPRNIGVWIVGFMAMAMLAAIVSGIIIHKKFFKEFFTFRPNKGQRSWLDYHNASGVLLLPFHIMITYTGLVIFFLIYMPAPLDALFDGDRQAYQAAMRGEVAEPQRQSAERGNRASPEGRGEGRSGGPREAGAAPRMREPVAFLDRSGDMDFAALLNTAQAQLGELSGFSLVRRANGEAVLEARPVLGNVIELSKGRSIAMNALTGEVIRPVPPSQGASWVQRVMAGLHFAQFGGYSMRWVYFICGLVSTAMMAGGLVLFSVKRRRRYAKVERATRWGYEWIERVNIAMVSGLLLACVGLLWVNRLVPVAVAERAATEVNLFFAIWGLSFIHASLRPWLKAWCEQLWLAGLLALALPLANALGGMALIGQGSHLYLELSTMCMGLVTLLAAWRVQQRVQQSSQDQVRASAQESGSC